MEGGRCLVVFEAFDDRTVDDDFVVLQLASDHSECVILLVVEDLHLAQARRAARGYPLLLAIVVDHHRCTGTDYALLAHHSGRNLDCLGLHRNEKQKIPAPFPSVIASVCAETALSTRRQKLYPK